MVFFITVGLLGSLTACPEKNYSEEVFLKRLLIHYWNWVSAKKSLPKQLKLDEPIARFIFDSNDVRKGSGTVRDKLFRDKGDEVSVFRVWRLDSTQIFWLAYAYLEPHYKKKARGYAQLTPKGITGAGLRIQRSEQPPRHAGIRGFPTERHLIKQARQQLA